MKRRLDGLPRALLVRSQIERDITILCSLVAALYLAEWIAPDFGLAQDNQAAFIQLLQIGQVTARFGVNPGNLDGIRITDQQTQGRLSARQRGGGFAQTRQRGFSLPGRDGQLGGPNKLGTDRGGRKDGLANQHPAAHQRLGSLAPIHFVEMAINLTPAQGTFF